MKKILVIMLLAGCAKSSDSDVEKKCYRCIFGASVTGVTPAPKDTCINPWDKIEQIEFVDEFGNELNSICSER